MQGYWNGEYKAQFRGITYEVTQSEGEFHWQNMHIGERRQGLLILFHNQKWIIDNQYGDGFYKLTIGEGSFQCGHKSVSNPKNIEAIHDSQINTFYDRLGLELEGMADDKVRETINPQEFKRLKALKTMIAKL